MPIGERFFRLLWLGPVGRGFVRLSMRGVRGSEAGTKGPARRPLVRRDGASPSGPGITPPPREAQLRPTMAQRVLPDVGGTDSQASLEARVAELERWRQSRGE